MIFEKRFQGLSCRIPDVSKLPFRVYKFTRHFIYFFLYKNRRCKANEKQHK
jgi:hypothetical protein